MNEKLCVFVFLSNTAYYRAMTILSPQQRVWIPWEALLSLVLSLRVKLYFLFYCVAVYVLMCGWMYVCVCASMCVWIDGWMCVMCMYVCTRICLSEVVSNIRTVRLDHMMTMTKTFPITSDHILSNNQCPKLPFIGEPHQSTLLYFTHIYYTKIILQSAVSVLAFHQFPPTDLIASAVQIF